MTTPPRVGGPTYTGGMGGAGGTIPTVPTPGYFYNVRQGDTWPGISNRAYGDDTLWQDLAYANPGKQCRKGERVYVPRRDELGGGVVPDATADARRFVDDRAAHAPDGQPLPMGDPALTGDLATARAAANVGAPGATPRTETGGPMIPDEKTHNTPRGGYTATGGVKRKVFVDEKVEIAEGAVGAKGKALGGDVEAQASGEVHGPAVRAEGKAAFGFSWRNPNMEKYGSSKYKEGRVGEGSEYKGPQIMAEVSGRARAELVGARGQASASYGNDVVGVKSTVRGEAFVGAEVGGKAQIGVSKEGVHAVVGGDAFVGAKVRGEVRGDLSVGGERLGSVGARGELWAGVGVTARAHANIGKDEDGRTKIKFGAKVGAALGVGFAGQINVDIDVTGVVNTAKKVGDAVGGAAKAVGDTVHKGWGAVKKGFNWATSWLD